MLANFVFVVGLYANPELEYGITYSVRNEFLAGFLFILKKL